MIEINETLLFVTSCFTTYINSINHKSIIESIEEIQKKEPTMMRSNAGGYQSPPVKSPKYDNYETAKLFEENIIPIAKTIQPQWSIPSTMDRVSYWYNVNPKYTYNREHVHPNSYLSGVYYLKVPENSGNIFFIRSQTEVDRMLFLNKELEQQGMFVDNNRVNAEHWFVPKEGLLILFPGHLNHYVEQNLTNDLDDRRISLSFNFH